MYMTTASATSETALTTIIKRLQALSPVKIWLLAISISVLMTSVIVSAMELLLKGTVTYDYLLTGFVASFLVASTIAALVIVLITRLNQVTQYSKWIKYDLAESEERYKLAIMASNSAMWDYNLATGRVYLSDNWSKFLCGVPRSTYTTIDDLTELVPEEERPAVREAILQVVKNHNASTYEVKHHVRKPNGDFIYVSSVGQVTKRDQDGRALHMIGINREITKSE